MSLYTRTNQVTPDTQVDYSGPVTDEWQSMVISVTLTKLALFIAEAWRDRHLTAQANSETDYQECVAYVTREMAEAGAAVGGPAGAEILTGGGSRAAQIVCRRVLSRANND